MIDWRKATGPSSIVINYLSPYFTFRYFAPRCVKSLYVTSRYVTLRCVNGTCKLAAYHYLHIGQSELVGETTPMDGTHVLQPGKGRDCDGPSLWQNGEAVGEAAVNPFLPQNRQNQELTDTKINSICNYLAV